ncbi:hypothetical protein ACFYWP_36780 [Actinacidiphila glaucinigra]|uniref:hypothetical protein n=1 Tax=Actinacidiphila glaucinigra TaxID=235986 RepID=UPI00368EF086
MRQENTATRNRSRARTVLLWEAVVVVAAMCCWLVLAVIYNNEGWATLLDGPKLPLAAGVLVAASLVASQLLCRSARKALRAIGYAIATVRFAVVLVVCVLIVQELYDYATAW